jgi:hypothetical protein
MAEHERPDWLSVESTFEPCPACGSMLERVVTEAHAATRDGPILACRACGRVEGDGSAVPGNPWLRERYGGQDS